MRGKAIAGALLVAVFGGVGCDDRMALSDSAAVAAGGKSVVPTEKAEAAVVNVKVFNKSAQLVGPFKMRKVVKSDADWQKQLTPEQYEISRGKGTERPFCGTLLDNKKEGVYACIGCALPLFASDSKFNSGTGWPSFFQPVAKENVTEHVDRAHGMTRTEILCARCDGHLGHVFDDGPRPTGLRFCVNSESLRFVEKEKLATLADPAAEEPPAASAASATSPSSAPVER